MHLIGKLWDDEHGILLSAEAVVVGTVAVVGLTAGLSVVATSVNEELHDVAFAIRSLDQSYSIPAQEGCGAMTAGSSFTQEPVEQSLDELRDVIRAAEEAEKSEKAQDGKDDKGERRNKKKKQDPKNI